MSLLAGHVPTLRNGVRLAVKRRVAIASSSLALLVSSGCAQQTGGGLSCNDIGVGPLADLVYPAPSATDVSGNVRTLILLAPAPQNVRLILLEAGSVSSSPSPIAAQPTAVPSPLPSPIATPLTASYHYFAVSVPTLTSQSTYQVQGLTNDGCHSTYAAAGQFTIQ